MDSVTWEERGKLAKPLQINPFPITIGPKGKSKLSSLLNFPTNRSWREQENTEILGPIFLPFPIADPNKE